MPYWYNMADGLREARAREREAIEAHQRLTKERDDARRTVGEMQRSVRTLNSEIEQARASGNAKREGALKVERDAAVEIARERQRRIDELEPLIDKAAGVRTVARLDVGNKLANVVDSWRALRDDSPESQAIRDAEQRALGLRATRDRTARELADVWDVIASEMTEEQASAYMSENDRSTHWRADYNNRTFTTR